MSAYKDISEQQARIANEISNELDSLIAGSLFGFSKHEESLGDFWFLVISAMQKSELCHGYWLQKAESQFWLDHKDKPTVFWGREYTEEFLSSDIPKITASAEKFEALSILALDFLLAQGADIEGPISYLGDTPLSASLRRLKTDALSIKLLQLGANPNSIITFSSPALRGSKVESQVQSPLTIAASNHLKRYRSVEALLDYGADVNFREYSLLKNGKKQYTNKAINFILHQDVASFNFSSHQELLHHRKVVQRVVDLTRFKHLELVRIFFLGALVTGP